MLQTSIGALPSQGKAFAVRKGKSCLLNCIKKKWLMLSMRNACSSRLGMCSQDEYSSSICPRCPGSSCLLRRGFIAVLGHSPRAGGNWSAANFSWFFFPIYYFYHWTQFLCCSVSHDEWQVATASPLGFGWNRHSTLFANQLHPPDCWLNSGWLEPGSFPKYPFRPRNDSSYFMHRR